MDAKTFGPFIAERRKELGLTQAQLAKKLHVTDKAVSRWERGVGLPDINSLEAIGEALDLSLLELMQAKREERESISKEEAEQMITETIRMSGYQERSNRILGMTILGMFLAISLFLIKLLFTDGRIVMYSVGSIITGLIAWGIPIWKITLEKNGTTDIPMLFSVGFAFLSIAIQFVSIKQSAFPGDISAILDTIRALIMVVVLFSAITLALNYWMIKVKKRNT